MLLVAIVLMCDIAQAQWARSQVSNPRYWAQKARFEAGVHGTTPERIIGNAIGSMFKGSAEANDQSYLNKDFGFKGKYPSSYKRVAEDGDNGVATFESSDGALSVSYCGFDASETTLADFFADEKAAMEEEYELISADCKKDEYTIVCNCGGTMMTERSIFKDGRIASILVTYPEKGAKSFKKQIKSLCDELTFYK